MAEEVSPHASVFNFAAVLFHDERSDDLRTIAYTVSEIKRILTAWRHPAQRSLRKAANPPRFSLMLCAFLASSRRRSRSSMSFKVWVAFILPFLGLQEDDSTDGWRAGGGVAVGLGMDGVSLLELR